MERDDLIKKLQEMNKPQIISESHQANLKLTLLNAKKSANIGIILVIIPCIFLLGILLKYLLHINIPAFTSFENWMSEIDKNQYLKIIFPLLFLGAPLVGLAINLLAILHFEFNSVAKELIITLKLKGKNIIIALICMLILLCFLIYAVGENL